MEASGQAQIREYVELVQFYNSKASKYEEITKLQETNMKVSEKSNTRLWKRDVRCWSSSSANNSRCRAKEGTCQLRQATSGIYGAQGLHRLRIMRTLCRRRWHLRPSSTRRSATKQCWIYRRVRSLRRRA